MPLEDVFEQTSPLQLHAWIEYWRLESTEPGLTDWQLMLVAREIRALQMTVASLARRVRESLPPLEDFQVKFKERKDTSSPETKQQAWRHKKAMLLGAYGFRPEQWINHKS